MAYVVADRVLEISATTGTGAFTLAGALDGYRAFSSVCTTSDTAPYYIEAVDVSGLPTGEWETGIGTYSGANTLTRSSVIASSNSNNAVNFGSGDKRVGITPLATQILGIRGGVLTGPLGLPASIAGAAPLNIPHGTAPSSPVDGDFWGTSAGFFGRINTVTRQFAMINGAQTFTTKTISLSNNTITGTLSEFNTALSDGDFASLAGSETLTNKTLFNPALNGTPTTDIFAISDSGSVTIDPADGEVQLWTLGANRTPTLTSITTGKAVLLLIDDGSARTLTLSGVTWLNNDGAAPTLKTSGYTPILLFNVGGTLYAWLCGDGG